MQILFTGPVDCVMVFLLINLWQKCDCDGFSFIKSLAEMKYGHRRLLISYATVLFVIVVRNHINLIKNRIECQKYFDNRVDLLSCKNW